MKLSNVFDDDRQKILEIALFMSMKPDQLNENTGKGALRMAKRAGLKITNGRGLVSILSKAGKYMAEVMYYAFKAHGGDKEARNQLKELMKKRVSKEEFVDFLLKLDTLTFSAITGPLHIIDAVKADDRLKIAIDSLLSSAEDLPDRIKKRVMTNISKLKKIVGV